MEARSRWSRDKVAMLILLAVPVLLLGKCAGDAIGHNIDRNRFADLVLDVPLPDDAVVVASSKEVGILVGNGNHCDLRVQLDLQTSLTPGQIRTNYSHLDSPGERTLTVARLTPEVIRVELFEFAGANPVGWDWRCG